METPQKIKNSSIHYICILHLYYSSIAWILRLFLILAIENNSAMNIRVHMSSQISVFIFFG